MAIFATVVSFFCFSSLGVGIGVGAGVGGGVGSALFWGGSITPKAVPKANQ